MLTITYIPAMALHMHTQGRIKNHTVHSLYRILDTATSVMSVMKMGNTVHRAGFEPTSLELWPSVLPLHHVSSLMSLPYLRAPVYVALCLRGQCRLLHFPANQYLSYPSYTQQLDSVGYRICDQPPCGLYICELLCLIDGACARAFWKQVAMIRAGLLGT